MIILNLCQYVATPEQRDLGVIEPLDKERVRKLLTFDKLPPRAEINRRARALAIIAQEHPSKPEAAMIGSIYDGDTALFLLSTLENELWCRRIGILYSFGKVVEDCDGNEIYHHIGWIKEDMPWKDPIQFTARK